MFVTVQNITQIEELASLKLIAGASGLDKPISKVSLLEYEFTKIGSKFSSDEIWQTKEFVVTTFVYAKDDPSMIFDAIRRMHAAKVSGIAIKNVFALPITQEIINYANARQLPIFLFTNNSLLLEDVLLTLNKYIADVSNQSALEQKIAEIVNGDFESSKIRKMALSINCGLSSHYIIAYLSWRDDMPDPDAGLLSRSDVLSLSRGVMLIKYGRGFFFIRSIDNSSKQHSIGIYEELKEIIGDLGVCHVGISNQLFFLSNFRDGLIQAQNAAVYAKIMDSSSANYASIGIYKLLLPDLESRYINQFYDSVILPIVRYDSENGSNFLEVALLYEQYNGNIKQIAAALQTHENTIRYRMKKIEEIVGQETAAGNIAEQLSVAIKIYRARNANGSLLLESY